MNGEETDGGRAMAHLASGSQQGTSYELTALGKAAWEKRKNETGDWKAVRALANESGWDGDMASTYYHQIVACGGILY